MRPALLALWASIAGCAHQADFYSAYGVAHCLEGVEGTGDTMATANAQEAYVMRALVLDMGWDMDRVRQGLQLLEVHWRPGPWTGPDGHEWAGETDGRVMYVARVPGGCAWQSAYRHELLHALGSWVRAQPDMGHMDKQRWVYADATVGCL
jgi:hypothetical protein